MLLQRICWNEYSWIRPSGPPKESAYPAQHGFGWDEWNFNLSDALNGEVYGHTPYTASNKAKAKLGMPFCVSFWTKEPYTKNKLLIGFYESAVWTSEEESNAFDNFLQNSGRWESREEQLLTIGLPKRNLSREFRPGGHVWKLKCAVERVRSLACPVILSSGLVERHQRFQRPRIWSEPDGPADLLNRCSATDSDEPERPLGYSRTLQAGENFIEQKEELLRVSFLKFLNSHPEWASKVAREVERIDVSFLVNGKQAIAELKTLAPYAKAEYPVRAAIGQLLNYNYGLHRTPASQWWIVLDREPDEAARTFIQRVARAHQMPLLVAHQAGESFNVWDTRRRY